MSAPSERRLGVAITIAVLVTLAVCWATWAVFLAPRRAEATLQGFAEAMARHLRDGDFDAVRERLDPAFSLEPHGFDRDATLAVARREHQAGRLHPYVAFTHLVTGDEDDGQAVVIGILAQQDPGGTREVAVQPVRVEMRVKQDGGDFTVLRARARIGR